VSPVSAWGGKGAGGGLPVVEGNSPVHNTAKEEGGNKEKKNTWTAVY